MFLFSDFALYVRDMSHHWTNIVLNATSAHPRYETNTALCEASVQPVQLTACIFSWCLQDGREWKHCSACGKCVKPCRSTNHIRHKLICSWYFHITTFWYFVCFLWLYLNAFPLSLGALWVLWPLCPSRPPVYQQPRKGGLLQLRKHKAQT